jgi:uncharacterized protein YlxP (DUF503 family)
MRIGNTEPDAAVAPSARRCYGPDSRYLEFTLVVGVARLALALGQSHSLKDKRAVVRKVVERTRARFQVAISEVADHDLWQKATLGIAAVGADVHHVRAVVDEVVRAIEELYVAPVVACDVQVDSYDDFATTTLADAEGRGPNAFTRELLAGDGGDDDIEDAPWAEPGPNARPKGH